MAKEESDLWAFILDWFVIFDGVCFYFYLLFQLFLLDFHNVILCICYTLSDGALKDYRKKVAIWLTLAHWH